MVQFLIVFIIPPIVGLVTYFVARLFWNRDGLAIAISPARRTSRSFDIVGGAEMRLRKLTRGFERIWPRLATVTLLTGGVIGGFVLGWFALS